MYDNRYGCANTRLQSFGLEEIARLAEEALIRRATEDAEKISKRNEVEEDGNN
jgi:hypothetical protein